MAQIPEVDNVYTGDGLNRTFDLTFPYLTKSEVFVSVDGQLVAFSWLSGATSSVELYEAPVAGSTVRVFRNTLAVLPRHLFDQGVPFLPRYVDENNRQLLYAVQEAIDSTAGTAAEALAVAEGAEVMAQQNLVDMQAQFDEFTQGIAVYRGLYAAGVVLRELDEYVKVDAATTGTTAGLYRPNASATLPLTLTGTWATDKGSLVLLGDDALRQELAGEEGAGLIGYGSGTVKSALDSLNNAFPTVTKSFDGIGDGVADDTEAVKAAFESNRTVIFDGVFKVGPLVITDRIVDARFAPGAKLVFTHTDQTSLEFVNCRGRLDNITIDDVPDSSSAGLTATLLGEHCERFVINGGFINSPKDLPIAWFECDNTWADDVVIIGSDTKRPFGCESIGSANSGFRRCGMWKTDFGFLLLGPGYKSGPPITNTTRTWEETLGQKAIDCWVHDHEGHAFDMNGTVGAEFRGCTAYLYTGTADGNPAFQIKNSTNIPEEVSGDTRFNWIRDCVAVDQVSAFFAQDASNGVFENNVAINCKRYALALNKSPRFRVKGLKIRDWALDLTNWPLQNGDTVAAAIAIWQNSPNCIVEDVEVEVTQNHANLGISTILNVRAPGATIGRVRIQKSISEQMHSAMVVSGAASNCHILDGFRPGGPEYYLQNPIVDASTTTNYPRQYGVVVPMSTAGTTAMPIGPQRAFCVAKIQVSHAGGSPSGAFSVGRVGAPSQLLGSTAVPSAEQRYDPVSSFVLPSEVVSATCLSTGVGFIRIMVLGVDML